MTSLERSIVWAMRVWRVIGAIFYFPLAFLAVGFCEIFGYDKITRPPTKSG